LEWRQLSIPLRMKLLCGIYYIFFSNILSIPLRMKPRWIRYSATGISDAFNSFEDETLHQPPTLLYCQHLAFNSFEDETEGLYLLRHRVVYYHLSIPLRMKPMNLLVQDSMKMNHAFNSFEDETWGSFSFKTFDKYTFNSFEDETSSWASRMPSPRWRKTFNSFEDETLPRRPPPAAVKRGSNFQFLWGWNLHYQHWALQCQSPSFNSFEDETH